MQTALDRQRRETPFFVLDDNLRDRRDRRVTILVRALGEIDQVRPGITLPAGPCAFQYADALLRDPSIAQDGGYFMLVCAIAPTGELSEWYQRWKRIFLERKN